MPITFELIDILLFVGICQGIFLTFALQRIVNTNKRANRMLTILIAISTFMLVGRFWMIRYFSEWIFYLGILFDSVIFVFGPLFYGYTKTFLQRKDDTQKLPFWHYIPVSIFGLYIVITYVQYTPDTFWQAYLAGTLTLSFRIILMAAILLNMYYLVRSFLVLRGFKKLEKHRFSFQQNQVQYITFFLIAISVIMLLWLASFVNSVFESSYFSFITYDLVWAAIPVFMYSIGYFSLRQPELFRIQLKPKLVAKKERLSMNEANLLQEKLDGLIKNDKIFLQPHLTLSEVSEMLHTSTNNVSWLLNKVYKTTFYDFINRYRIEEFVKKIENNEHLRHTILALSLEVGFNSKSTFNKAFKTYKQDTPSNFIKKYQAA